MVTSTLRPFLVLPVVRVCAVLTPGRRRVVPLTKRAISTLRIHIVAPELSVPSVPSAEAITGTCVIRPGRTAMIKKSRPTTTDATPAHTIHIGSGGVPIKSKTGAVHRERVEDRKSVV